MHRHSSGLVHHNEVFVLVKDFDRNVFGRGFERRPRRGFDLDAFSTGYAMRALGRGVIHPHQALIDQLLDACPA